MIVGSVQFSFSIPFKSGQTPALDEVERELAAYLTRFPHFDFAPNTLKMVCGYRDPDNPTGDPPMPEFKNVKGTIQRG